MSDSVPQIIVELELTRDQWIRLNQVSGFVRAQVDCFDIEVDSFPYIFSFGVPNTFQKPKYYLDLVLKKISGEPHYHIDSVGEFLEVVDYLIFEEEFVLGILQGGGNYNPSKETFLLDLHRAERLGFKKVLTYLKDILGLSTAPWHSAADFHLFEFFSNGIQCPGRSANTSLKKCWLKDPRICICYKKYIPTH